MHSNIDATLTSEPTAENGPLGLVSSRVLRATIDAPRLDRDLALARVERGLLGCSSGPIKLARFTVLHRLGRGGMGVVYAAYDPELEREVALKRIDEQAGAMGRLGGRAQLLREARTAAVLNHPNVVTIYEVGTHEDSAYIAMELVEGPTLRAWQNEHRRGWRQILAMYASAGRGLVAAHAAGLIHRDFKPDNVLIGRDGRPRVADFGLARSMPAPSTAPMLGEAEGAPQCIPTSVAGTPCYMAPEQHEGQGIGPAADQFAFCVALYEAVYGERPYERTSPDRMRRRGIRPAPPHTRVPTRLRRVLRRGLARDPKERWPTVSALLEQLEPLLTPAPWQPKRIALAMGLVMVGGLLGWVRDPSLPPSSSLSPPSPCSGAVDQLSGIWDDARRLEVRDAILGVGLSYAVDTWEWVRTQIDGYADAWVHEYTAVCKAARVTQEQTEEEMSLRMGCLRRQRAELNAAVEVLLHADDAVMAQAADLVSLHGLSRCGDVEWLREQRLRIPPPPTEKAKLDVERLREQLAGIEAERRAGRYDRATERIEVLLPQAEARGYGPLQAEVGLLHGRLRIHTGEYAEAERDLVRAHALAIEHGHDELVLTAARLLTDVVGNRQARHAEGLVWGQAALPVARRSGAPIDQAAIEIGLGTVLKRQGRHEDAQARYRRALATYESVWGPEHPAVAGVVEQLGNVLVKQGRYGEAEHRLRRALRIYEQALGHEHPYVARSLNNLGGALLRQGRLGDAEALYRRSLRIRERALRSDHPDVASTRINLGGVLYAQKRWSEAEAQYRRGLERLVRALGEEHPDVAATANNLAAVLIDLRRYPEAESQLRRARQIWERTLGSEHPRVAHGSNNLGRLLEGQGRYEQAEAEYRRALATWEHTLGSKHPHVAHALLGLATVALARQRPVEARDYAERAVAIREAAGAASGLLAEARFTLARALWAKPATRSRAHAVARQAMKEFTEQGSGADAADVDRWLRRHRLR